MSKGLEPPYSLAGLSPTGESVIAHDGGIIREGDLVRTRAGHIAWVGEVDVNSGIRCRAIAFANGERQADFPMTSRLTLSVVEGEIFAVSTNGIRNTTVNTIFEIGKEHPFDLMPASTKSEAPF